MAKQTVTVTVDSDVIEEIRQLRINISGEINQFLRDILNRYNEDLEGINIQLERIRYEKAIKKVNHWQSQSKICLAKIEKWEDSQKEVKEKELKDEKDKIEALHKCKNCGLLLSEKAKKHKFPIGMVCNACFLSESKEKFKIWAKNE